MISFAALSLLVAGLSSGSTTQNPTWGGGMFPVHFEGETTDQIKGFQDHDCFRGGLGGVFFNPEKHPMPGHIYFDPGTMLYSSEPDYQVLIILWGYDDDYDDDDYGYYDDDYLASIDHGPLKPHKKAMHVACTEMTKKMPTKMKFRAKVCPDPILVKLCEVGKNAPIRGLYDQPRIWIYTDHATREQCNEHLQREITPAIYLRALWEASTVGGVDLDKPAVRKCVDPKLIEGINAPMDAKVYLVQTLDKIDPKGLEKTLKSDTKPFAKLIDTDRDETNMAELLDALADSKTPEVVAALPDFIKNAIPASHHDAVLGHCKHQFN